FSFAVAVATGDGRQATGDRRQATTNKRGVAGHLPPRRPALLHLAIVQRNIVALAHAVMAPFLRRFLRWRFAGAGSSPRRRRFGGLAMFTRTRRLSFGFQGAAGRFFTARARRLPFGGLRAVGRAFRRQRRDRSRRDFDRERLARGGRVQR